MHIVFWIGKEKKLLFCKDGKKDEEETGTLKVSTFVAPFTTYLQTRPEKNFSSLFCKKGVQAKREETYTRHLPLFQKKIFLCYLLCYVYISIFRLVYFTFYAFVSNPSIHLPVCLFPFTNFRSSLTAHRKARQETGDQLYCYCCYAFSLYITQHFLQLMASYCTLFMENIIIIPLNNNIIYMPKKRKRRRKFASSFKLNSILTGTQVKSEKNMYLPPPPPEVEKEWIWICECMNEVWSIQNPKLSHFIIPAHKKRAGELQLQCQHVWKLTRKKENAILGLFKSPLFTANPRSVLFTQRLFHSEKIAFLSQYCLLCIVCVPSYLVRFHPILSLFPTQHK